MNCQVYTLLCKFSCGCVPSSKADSLGSVIYMYMNLVEFKVFNLRRNINTTCVDWYRTSLPAQNIFEQFDYLYIPKFKLWRVEPGGVLNVAILARSKCKTPNCILPQRNGVV